MSELLAKFIDFHHASIIQLVKDINSFKNLNSPMFDSIISALEERIIAYCNEFRRVIIENDTESMNTFVTNYENVFLNQKEESEETENAN
jgi:hypothetical protein